MCDVLATSQSQKSGALQRRATKSLSDCLKSPPKNPERRNDCSVSSPGPLLAHSFDVNCLTPTDISLFQVFIALLSPGYSLSILYLLSSFMPLSREGKKCQGRFNWKGLSAFLLRQKLLFWCCLIAVTGCHFVTRGWLLYLYTLCRSWVHYRVLLYCPCSTFRTGLCPQGYKYEPFTCIDCFFQHIINADMLYVLVECFCRICCRTLSANLSQFPVFFRLLFALFIIFIHSIAVFLYACVFLHH